jgi:hypothetical protein
MTAAQTNACADEEDGDGANAAAGGITSTMWTEKLRTKIREEGGQVAQKVVTLVMTVQRVK